MGKSLWVLNHYAISPDMSGGTRHYDLAKELVQRGHEVTIFASGFDHNTRKYVKVQPGEKLKVEEYAGVRFVWINTFPYSGNDWRRVLNMLSYSWRILSSNRRLPKPDAVIGSSMHPFAALSGWWLARKYKAKFYFEVRDLWPQVLIDMGKMDKLNPIIRALRLLELFLYHNSEQIIILGNQMKDYIIANYNVSTEKIVWIPNGVDFAKFDDVGSTKSKDECRSRFCVMYLGAHSKTNALHTLIEAAKIIHDGEYKDIHFILVGDGPEKQNLIELARIMELKNVEFCRSVSKDKVPYKLGEADVLVITKDPTFAKYSGSILKMFDYMASGKPVVFSGEAYYNPIREGKCGYTVSPGNAIDLARAIVNLYHMSEDERLKLGINGREYVKMYHDTRILATKLEETLKFTVET